MIIYEDFLPGKLDFEASKHVMSDTDNLWSENGDPNKGYRVQKYGLTYKQWEDEANNLANCPTGKNGIIGCIYSEPFVDSNGKVIDDKRYFVKVRINALGYIPASKTESGKREILSTKFSDRVIYRRDANGNPVIITYHLRPKKSIPFKPQYNVGPLPKEEQEGFGNLKSTDKTVGYKLNILESNNNKAEYKIESLNFDSLDDAKAFKVEADNDSIKNDMLSGTDTNNHIYVYELVEIYESGKTAILSKLNKKLKSNIKQIYNNYKLKDGSSNISKRRLLGEDMLVEEENNFDKWAEDLTKRICKDNGVACEQTDDPKFEDSMGFTGDAADLFYDLLLGNYDDIMSMYDLSGDVLDELLKDDDFGDYYDDLYSDDTYMHDDIYKNNDLYADDYEQLSLFDDDVDDKEWNDLRKKYHWNDYKPKPKPEVPFESKSNTLVLHRDDPSTVMLKQIYEGKGFDEIHNDDMPASQLNRLIDEHERIIMLGHGTGYGLMGMGVTPSTAEHFKGKKLFVIWCNADKYFLDCKIGDGMFITGNMPSEVGESLAAGCGNISKELMLENITYWSKLCADVCERCLAGDVKSSVDYVRLNYLERYGNHPVTIYNAERTQALNDPQPLPKYTFKGKPLEEKDFPTPEFNEEEFLKNPVPHK